MKMQWENGFEIRVRLEHGAAVISANREGLLSLSHQLAVLAQAAPGSHIHYDAGNSLEEGSDELIVEKLEKTQES